MNRTEAITKLAAHFQVSKEEAERRYKKTIRLVSAEFGKDALRTDESPKRPNPDLVHNHCVELF